MDTALSAKLGDGSTIALEYNWSSSDGTNVMVNKITPSGMLDEELFHTEDVPKEWHLGHFTSDDVATKFLGKFNRIVAQERQKLSKRKTVGPYSIWGQGPGWHGERARHSAAGKKGKR